MEESFETQSISSIKPIRDIVYDSLKRAIINGQLRPGERIVENDYAEKMNISRTPIREALRRLESEDLVEYIARKGVVVKSFSVAEIIEICEIRKSLECLSIKYVIENITDFEIEKLKRFIEDAEMANENNDIEGVFKLSVAFNDAFLNACRLPRLISMINALQEHLQRFRRITMSKGQRRANAICEHKGILLAVIEKDRKKAELLIGTHIEGVQRTMLENIKVRDF